MKTFILLYLTFLEANLTFKVRPYYVALLMLLQKLLFTVSFGSYFVDPTLKVLLLVNSFLFFESFYFIYLLFKIFYLFSFKRNLLLKFSIVLLQKSIFVLDWKDLFLVKILFLLH
jgi:hypothetical protein